MNIIQHIFCIILFFSVSISAKNLSGSLTTLISSTWGLPSADPAYRSWRAYKLRPGSAALAWAVLLECLLWVLPLPCLATCLGDPVRPYTLPSWLPTVLLLGGPGAVSDAGCSHWTWPWHTDCPHHLTLCAQQQQEPWVNPQSKKIFNLHVTLVIAK